MFARPPEAPPRPTGPSRLTARTGPVPSCRRAASKAGRRTPPRLLLALLLTAMPALGGCAEAAPAWEGTVRDSAGIEIVTSPAEGVWTPEAAWTLEEELRIGGGLDEADEAKLFGMVASVDAGSDGRIYVLDADAQEVRVFDRQGDHVTTYGGGGSGPGELGQGAVRVLAAPDGRVYVPDPQNARISIYAEGEEPASVPFRVLQNSGTGVMAPVRFQLAPDGRILIQLRTLPLPGQPPSDPDAGDPVVAYDPTGRTSPDTVTFLPPGETFQGPGGAPGILSMKLFAPEPAWTLLDAGTVAVAMSDDYRITYRTLGGSIERIVEKDFERRMVTEADQERVRQMLRKLVQDRGQPAQVADMMLQQMSFAESYPVFAGFLAGPTGTLWVQRIADARELAVESMEDFQDLGSPNWDVFDRQGRFLGTVRMPDRFQPMTWEGDALYGVQRDELDVQSVVRLRLNM